MPRNDRRLCTPKINLHRKKDANIQTIDQLILKNRCVSMRATAELTGIHKEKVCQILPAACNMKNPSSEQCTSLLCNACETVLGKTHDTGFESSIQLVLLTNSIIFISKCLRLLKKISLKWKWRKSQRWNFGANRIICNFSN